jgi:hypothetical protein
MAVDLGIKQGAIRPNSWIDHDDVNRLGWKVGNASAKKEGGVANVLRRDLVAQIDNSGLGIE